MKAITVVPGQAETARVDEVEEPDLAEGAILVDALALGICGTDQEIVGGEYGWAPPSAGSSPATATGLSAGGSSPPSRSRSTRRSSASGCSSSPGASSPRPGSASTS